jgi:hypothetical protein
MEVQILNQLKEIIKKDLEDYANELSVKLSQQFDDKIEGKRTALVLEAASKIMTVCQLRAIDRDSTEVRIIVNRKEGLKDETKTT